MATRGKSARELQAEIDDALRKRQRQLGRSRWRRFAVVAMFVIAGLALAAVAVWLGLAALGLDLGIWNIAGAPG
jgi:hypothetical protein